MSEAATSTLAARPDDWHFPETSACRFVPLTAKNQGDWLRLLAALPEQPVGLHPLHIEYQHVYFSSVYPRYRRLDCLLVLHGQSVGVWPLAIFGNDQSMRLSSHLNGSTGIVPPALIGGLSEKQEKTIARAWLDVIARLCADFAVAELEFAASPNVGDLPIWHALLMEAGAHIAGRHRLIADLTLNEAAYHQQLRKSYKALINAAHKLWQVEIDASGDAEQFAAFQHLHEEVAGRKTRSAESWQRQFDAIPAGAAFAIYLRDTADTLVGASLFNRSRDEAYYAVGAYRRELFDQPLTHLSLDEAIRFARQQGIRRFILGQRAYPADTPPPTAKEEQIAFFKEGFATGLQLLPILGIAGNRLLEAGAKCESPSTKTDFGR